MITGTMTAKPQVFAAAVKWAARFVAPRAVVPAHACLTLIAGGGQLTVLAFNENVTARATLPIGGDASGAAAVSGSLLNSLVGTFPDKPVSITGDEHAVTITAGRWRGTLPTMPEGEMPDAGTAPSPIGRVDGTAFADLAARVAVAADKDPTHKMATVLLTFGEAEVQATSCDMYRAARVTVAFENDYDDETGPDSALILGEVLNEAAAGFIGPDQVTVGLSGHALSLTTETRSVILRQIGGEQDPRIAGFFAVTHPETATVRVADLLGSAKRATLMREKGGAVRIGFSADAITVLAAAKDIQQDSDEAVDAEYAGPDHVLAFNPSYLADALQSAPGDTVRINLTTERVTGVILSVPGNDDWRHLLMPLKI